MLKFAPDEASDSEPAEEPIVLLGSVFDANSLGKWIYDWTVYHHGASSPSP